MNYLQHKKQAMIFMHQSFIPSGYKRVEYLESTGTQWIDSGLTVDGLLEFNTNFELTSKDMYDCLFGETQGGIGYYYCFMLLSTNNHSYFQYRSNETSTNVVLPLNTKTNVYTDNGGLFINGIRRINFTKYNFISNTTIPIFAQYGNGVIRRFAKVKLYSLKFSKNNKTLRDFIPCLDNNNRPCMYDTVSKQTYYNEGNGEFLYGEVIN